MIDLLLGLFLLIPVVLWIASVSSLLAIVVSFGAAGLYVASISRRGRGRKRREVAVRASRVEDRDPLAALDDLLAAAPPIPLTDWVRVDPRVASPLIAELREAAIDPGRTERAEELSREILEASPLLFTDELRVDRRRARMLLQELRQADG